jgi:hypothetical protein
MLVVLSCRLSSCPLRRVRSGHEPFARQITFDQVAKIAERGSLQVVAHNSKDGALVGRIANSIRVERVDEFANEPSDLAKHAAPSFNRPHAPQPLETGEHIGQGSFDRTTAWIQRRRIVSATTTCSIERAHGGVDRPCRKPAVVAIRRNADESLCNGAPILTERSGEGLAAEQRRAWFVVVHAFQNRVTSWASQPGGPLVRPRK